MSISQAGFRLKRSQSLHWNQKACSIPSFDCLRLLHLRSTADQAGNNDLKPFIISFVCFSWYFHAKANSRLKSYRSGRCSAVTSVGDALPHRLSVQRWRSMLGLVLAYSCYYVCRYSLTFVAPALMLQEGTDLPTIGLLLSTGQITIGVSKMVSSIITSDYSPKCCLMMGLGLAAAFNFLASFSLVSGNGVAVLSLCWACNGISQGLGSPACARIINSWCHSNERGFFWSLWNTSNNIGGAIAPLIVGIGLSVYGWRGGLLAAGFSAVVALGCVGFLVRDEPPIDSSEREPGIATMSSQQVEDHSNLSGFKLLWYGCICQSGFTKLLLANFLIYAVRGSLISWFTFYVTAKGLADASHALVAISSFELGGLVGSFVSGPLSDMRSRKKPRCPAVGVRLDVALLAVLACLLPALLALTLVSRSSGSFPYPPIMVMAGIGLYIAQSLAALSGLELVPSRAVGISQGVLGLAAYAGAAASGLPLGVLIQGRLGWKAWQISLLLGSAMIAAVLVSLRHLQSYGQRVQISN